MKVKELVKKLLEQDQDAEIIMASDAEGNNFSILHDFDAGLGYMKYDYEIELVCKEDDEERYDESKPCIVFWP